MLVEPLNGYSPEAPPSRETPPGRPLWPYVAAVVVIILAVAIYLVVFRARARPEPSPPSPAPPPPAAEAPPSEPEAAIELPPLAASDEWLRLALAELSAHPELARWLVTDDLVRRFTAAVDNVADGVSPRPHVGFLEPGQEFVATERGGKVTIDPRSYRRYTRLAEVVASLDALGAVELYRSIRPLIQEAYADLGYPDRDFDQVLARAIRHLQATPVPASPIELVPGVEAFEFRDPALEGLSPAQKHMLRMGPDNAAVVRAKLGEIAALLGVG